MKQITVRQKQSLQSLQKKVKNLKTVWNPELGVIKQMHGDLDKVRTREKSEIAVHRFVCQQSELLGQNISPPTLKVFRTVATPDNGKRISMHLLVEKMVLLDGRVTVYVDSKKNITRVMNSLPRKVTLTGKATISQKDLLRILQERFMSHPDAEEYLVNIRKKDRTTPPPATKAGTKKPRPVATSFPMTSKPQLVVKRTAKGFRPVWMGFAVLPVDVETPLRSKELHLTQAEYFIDAVDGSWIKAEATIEFADVSSPVSGYAVIRPDDTLVEVTATGIQRDGAQYYLKNIDKDIDIIVYDADGNGTNLENRMRNDTVDMSQDPDNDWDTWTDSTDAATRNDAQQPEIDALSFAEQIYDYYQGLNWKGFDNEGWDSCPVQLVTHIGMSPSGTGAAFEKFTDMTSGNKHGYLKFYDGYVDGGDLKYDFFAGELGTIAHEYQHAVTYFAVTTTTGDPGGLYSDTIRGSFREGYSDSFAGLISGNWLLRPPWPTGIAISGEPLRRIEYPRSTDTLSADGYCDHYDDIADVNDKYFKSTILSHAAFLLGEGGIHDRPGRDPQYIPVPPIGKDKVARIWMRTLTEKLDGLAAGGGDQRMVEVGDYLLESAEELYGINSTEYVLLRRALFAVGVFPYDVSVSPYVKQSYGGEACMIPWGVSWKRSQHYLSLPMFYYYKSIDLFVDNGDGQEYDVNIGDENKLFARVRNIGDQNLNDITIEFWYRKHGSALPAEEIDWRRCQDADGVDCTLHIDTLNAGESFFENVYNDSHAVMWFLDPAEIIDEIDHFCLRAKITCDSPNHNNDYENYVQSNVRHVIVDSDSDIETVLAFQVANHDRKKELPVDLKIDHTLPAGAVIRPKTDLEKIVLKPGEERTVLFSVYMPKNAISAMRPPFDGVVEGHLHGELCGPFKGNISQVKYVKKTRSINALLAGDINHVGSIVGRFKGILDRKNRIIVGTATVIFNGRMKDRKINRRRLVGVKVELKPLRVINFTQLKGTEPLGGITIPIVEIKKK